MSYIETDRKHLFLGVKDTEEKLDWEIFLAWKIEIAPCKSLEENLNNFPQSKTANQITTTTCTIEDCKMPPFPFLMIMFFHIQ